MSIQEYPCADCEDVIHIGDGEGLCDWGDPDPKKTRLVVVNLFDVHPLCPKPKKPSKGFL